MRQPRALGAVPNRERWLALERFRRREELTVYDHARLRKRSRAATRRGESRAVARAGAVARLEIRRDPAAAH